MRRETMKAQSSHAKQQAMHNANDAFVKRQQSMTAKLGGKAPNLTAEATEYNAYMCNNGENAQDFASKLTSGIDKTAFPVK